MRTALRAHLVPVLLLVATGAAPAQETYKDVSRIARVSAELLVPALTYPPASKITVQLRLNNPARVPVEVPAECLEGSAFNLERVSDREIFKPHRGRRAEALTLAPGERLERQYELHKLFRKLKTTGRYVLHWECGEWISGREDLYIVEPYDPERDKVAVVTTNLGVMEFAFMPLRAPEHVRNFVQLARQGHYDGLRFYRIIPGVQAETGDRKGDGTGGWRHMLPPEVDETLAPQKGMVGAMRRGETSMTSMTQIFILLEPSPGFRGMHTFFAYLRKGEEVLDALGQIPTSGNKGYGAFRPLEPVRIESIEIREE